MKNWIKDCLVSFIVVVVVTTMAFGIWGLLSFLERLLSSGNPSYNVVFILFTFSIVDGTVGYFRKESDK